MQVIFMQQYEKYALSHAISIQEIVTADYMQEPVWDDVNHIHADAWELCCCLQGTLDVEREHTAFALHSGEVLFIPPGTDHLVAMRQAESKAFVISFTCTGDSHLRPLQNNVIPVGDPLLMTLQSIREELEMSFLPEENALHLLRFQPNDQPPFGAEQMIASYLEQFLIRLLRSLTMAQGRIVTSSGFRSAMQRYQAEQVVEYIRAHLGEPLTVERIAAHFHYSRSRLTTICKQSIGSGINELIAAERIEAAKRMLTEQQKTVAQIAQELGFSTPHYFSYKFKQLVGCAPSFYAQQQQQP